MARPVSALRMNATIEGIPELMKTLEKFPGAIQRRILRPVLSAEGSKVVSEARENVPRQTGLLRKSLGKKMVTYKNGGVICVVGPRRGFKQVIDGKPRNPTKYAHLVEYGTKPHPIVTKFSGRIIYSKKGKVKGRNYTTLEHPGARRGNYLSKAYKTALNGAAERMAVRMAAEVEKLAAKGKLKVS